MSPCWVWNGRECVCHSLTMWNNNKKKKKKKKKSNRRSFPRGRKGLLFSLSLSQCSTVYTVCGVG